MKYLTTLIFSVAMLANGDTIKFYTEFPNSVPVGSDFLLFQRNNDFINSSVSQMKQDWFNNPVFSGNGGIQGVWTAVTFVGDGSQLTGITVGLVTNTTITTITNTTFVNTNVTILTSNAFFNNVYETNVVSETVTNNTFVNTNVTILTSNVFVNNEYVTNLTILGTGTGAFIENNNGNGTNTTLWGTTIFDELDVDNAYLTNLFLTITNAPFLATDGDGKVIAGSGTITNDTTIVENFYSTYITNFLEYSTNLYVTTNFTDVSYTTNLFATNLTVLTNNTFISYVTNLFVTTNITDTAYITNLFTTNITAKNLTVNNFYAIGGALDNLTVTNGITNNSLSASQFVATDANKKLVSTLDGSTLTKVPTAVTNEVTRQINSATNIYASLGTAVSAIESATNLSYIIKTNNGGGNALVSGAPGTALTCIITNIAATTTLGAMTFWTAGMSVIPVYVTASSANQILKFPANFQGSGDLYGIDLNATGVTVTNAEASWFEVRCIYGVKTNVFRSNTK